MTVLGRLVEL